MVIIMVSALMGFRPQHTSRAVNAKDVGNA
jgi:hypothetical protein